MRIILPVFVKNCLQTITDAGYEAYVVGGAVRSVLLGKTPNDYDITTSAHAEVIQKLFKKTVPTGLKHGTVTVVISGKNIEVTTYRTDGDYADNRHPSNVNFVSSLSEDLKRRDFTVNAIAYNETSGLIDLFGGIEDLKNGILRTVGTPRDRFCEDALRILRCYRFACQLNFKIEKETQNAAVMLSHLLKNISAERIFSELKKVFLSDNPQRINRLFETDFFVKLFGKKAIIDCSVLETDKNFSKRFSVFCFKNKIDAKAVLKALKADNLTVKNTEFYYKVLSVKAAENPIQLKKYVEFIAPENLIDAFLFRSELFDDENLKYAKEIIKNKEPYRTDMLDINGGEIKNSGFSGADIGNKLKTLLEICIEHPENNKNDILNKFIKKL